MGRFISTQPVVLNLPTLIDALPKQGEMITASSVLSYPGGGFVGMAAAAELGSETCMLSVLGTGPNSYVARRELLERGIQILTNEVMGDIGLAVSLVESDGHTTVVLSPGVEAEPDIEEYRGIELRSDDVVLVHGACLTKPTVAKAYVRWVSEIPMDVKVVVAPSPIVHEVDAQLWIPLLQRADYLTMNHRENKLLAEIVSQLVPAQSISDLLCPDATIVVRNGDEGCRYWVNSAPAEVSFVPAFDVEAVDTSGVGDTHVSVMCGAIAQNLGIQSALQAANAAGACMIGHAHAFPPPSQDEMLKMLVGI